MRHIYTHTYMRWEYQNPWPASLEICMQIKKQQLEPDMGQGTGSKLRKEYVKTVCCHPAYLTYRQCTSCKMPGWMKHKLESRFLGEVSITSDIQMTPSLWQKWKRTLKAQHSENEDHGIQSHHFMANRWGNSGNSVRLCFFGLQNHCRRWLQPWK